MATLDAIRAAIVAKLRAIPDIGVVNDYERFAMREADLKAVYVADIRGVPQLRGWCVRRTASASVAFAAGAGGRRVRRHTWAIRGYMALADADASEKVFDGLIEAIDAAFYADLNLSGVVSAIETESESAVQVDESLPVLFCSVLCHGARLRLTTLHYE